jgi:hypothetical protein
MFNSNRKDSMFLIIERRKYDALEHSFDIAQNTTDKSKAEEYKKALDILHADDSTEKSFTIVEVADDTK